MAEPLRLVFMGSDPVALPLLDWLAGEGRGVAQLVGFVTGPDRPSGRGQGVKPNAVAAWASGRPYFVMQPQKLEAGTLASLSALRPDLALVVAYGHILRDEFISVPRLGTLNLHASLLPAYRGASPIQSAVASGDRETGMTLMRIVRELDAGPVADMEKVAIGPLDTAQEVEDKLAAAAIPLLLRALPLLAEGRLAFRPQDGARATFCRRLAKSDGALDFSAPAARLASRINGLHPWPSATVDLAGVSVRLGLADSLGEGPSGAPGSVAGADPEGVLVATGSGILRLRRLQRPGGRMLGAQEFLRGFPVPAGIVIASRPMPELVAAAPFGR
ncbi:MAG TPA: methionyl-tRNA formyltransferase [Opitutaceae bacterium]